jgi:hypothetical protein
MNLAAALIASIVLHSVALLSHDNQKFHSEVSLKRKGLYIVGIRMICLRKWFHLFNIVGLNIVDISHQKSFCVFVFIF